MDMPTPIHNLNSLPFDIVVNIALFLQASDVCTLGSCSRYWRGICGSDAVWKALCRDRWPDFSLGENSMASHSQYHETEPCSKVWRGLYISKHKEMAAKADLLKGFVEKAIAFESIEVGNYLKAIELLGSLQFGFKDVEMFLLKPNLRVLLNLVGLHYCILSLNTPAGDILEALNTSNISERQVCVQWWKLGRWFYGFRLRDELHSRSIYLRDLAVPDEEVLGVLNRGAIHEVIRVQILPVVQSSPSWSHLV